jgi:hypothetical protein
MKLDPRQSHYVLQTLLVRGKVGARHVKEILRDWQKEIAALRERLATLEGLGGRGAAKAGRKVAAKAARKTVAKAAGKTVAKARVKRRLSPRVLALRRQQGRYMGLVRRMKEAEKARVRAVREKKGLPAAIRLALSLGRS